MEIRVQRSITVLPQHARSFLKLALEMAEHSRSVTGVESEVFYNVHSGTNPVDVRIFTDFESMASYEKVFLGKLLHDAQYLKMAAATVEMISDEPLDEMFVRMLPDDYFMNLDDSAKHGRYTFESAKRRADFRPRYRREREYCASKGRLREVMKMNFDFMDAFYKRTGMVPDYFCTRFSAQRIGCSKAYFDTDECPECTPAFLEQEELITRRFEGLLLTRPIDSLYMRVTPQDLTFSLS